MNVETGDRDGRAGDGAGGTEPSLSRRSLLQSVPAAVGALLIASAGLARQASVGAVVTTPRGEAPHPTTTSTASRPVPTRLPELNRPLFTLADYRRVMPGPAFAPNAVALTIDDGPHPHWTPRILRLLDRYHVPALFCMIGNQVLGHESTARSVVGAGHQIANHSWSHPAMMAEQTPRQAHGEIFRTQDKIYTVTGFTPTLFRAPGGSWSPALLRTAAEAHMLPLDWSEDPRDWAKPGVAAITRRLLAARPEQILLCHDGGGDRSQTLTALQTVIPALQARGYQFVALDSRL